MSAGTFARKMEPASLDAGRRTATVNDMIKWLWHDGFYRNESGADRQLQLPSNFDMSIEVDLELDMNVGFRKTATGTAHEKRGVSMEDVQSLTSGKATSAYKTLPRLEKATGAGTPRTPPRFHVVSDLLPGEWMAVDSYLPQTYSYEPSHENLLRRQVDPQFGSHHSADQETGMREKIWAYKIADHDEDDADKRNLERWKALCDEEEC
ncbi:hypothetical protein AJ78_06771 [Emergomyces pasteurianus Ep9510]|uniref:Uncharacterized protein n=1 Tax=Emergomyces pasteurianus Ep9510 TaxID=1447872 RepID=A0A1J9P9Q3_9EURO|nr:hypothetical protein AJ78_06771 [Emergomyces pasteurianus Ep9510]